ncbi:AraC family transcriptional regulator ligand-binding domain-containing protein [Yoonia sp.]|uniref:AraC family transcriptional regulator n=1 Tax=Yoonia sp. TaxID=2212373 RepID=UPI0025FC1D69|nr:AraC family transcriptional regulator ligand-binding domain-containing protein [Yoonia sp.]
MTSPVPTILSTVSIQFIDDWVSALRGSWSDVQVASFLQRSGLVADQRQPHTRVTLDQVVRLYQIAAVETGDEMMGLWSRPIRPRALQHLLTSVREAASLPSALYRFSTFWNLLLDDYQFKLTDSDDCLRLVLCPSGDVSVQRFGHMLILKLAHGLMSWLAGYEVPVMVVDFAFDRPEFAEDYAVIFPAPSQFGAPASAISFDPGQLGPPQSRSAADLADFLKNAPQDWIFTNSHEHTQSLLIREFLSRSQWVNCNLAHAAQALNMTPRTLMRRLDADGTCFQAIKDGLRRDIAIRDLQAGRKSIEEISQDIGFSSAANFHRAFLRWTHGTPSSYRHVRG